MNRFQIARARSDVYKFLAVLFLVVLVPLGPAAYAQAVEDGDANNMAMDGMSHDEHEMTPEMFDELRGKIPLYQDYTDEQMRATMQMMAPNYEVYVSNKGVNGSLGVLVLAHGAGEVGDRTLAEKIEPLGQIFPMAISFGMTMMQSSHIQSSIDHLVAAGAKKILVMPAMTTTENSQLRQWHYVFGLRDEATYATIPRVKTDVEVIVAPPLEGHPLLGEVVLDYANELSEDPSNESVFLVAHGPTDNDDNEKVLVGLNILAKYILEDGAFSEVKVISLQNDAPKPIRDANIKKLRSWTASANNEGKPVLIVTNLIFARGIQNQIREALEGYEYKFNAKAVSQHPNFAKWIEEAIRKELQGG